MKKLPLLLFVIFALGIADAVAQKTAFDFFSEGQKKYSEKDIDGAMTAFNGAVALDPHHALSHTYRGLILRTRKDFDGAIAAYTKAIESGIFNKAAPESYADDYGNRGRIFLEQKNDLDAAIADLTKAIETGKSGFRSTHLSNRAKAYTRKGNHEGSIGDYTELIKGYPTAAIYYTMRAGSYRSSGKIALAEADERTAAELKKK
ncbi:MAG: tetratricopeptide repeat protein [Pyrinomonadaceae bacterium]